MSERPPTSSTNAAASGAIKQSEQPAWLNGYALGCLAYVGFGLLLTVFTPGHIAPTAVIVKNRSSKPVRVESVERTRIERLGVVNAFATARFTLARSGRYYRLRLRDPAGKLLAGRAVLREDLDQEGKRTTWEVEWDGKRWIR